MNSAAVHNILRHDEGCSDWKMTVVCLQRAQEAQGGEKPNLSAWFIAFIHER